MGNPYTALDKYSFVIMCCHESNMLKHHLKSTNSFTRGLIEKEPIVKNLSLLDNENGSSD